jgi:hypothetical protein
LPKKSAGFGPTFAVIYSWDPLLAAASAMLARRGRMSKLKSPMRGGPCILPVASSTRELGSDFETHSIYSFDQAFELQWALTPEFHGSLNAAVEGMHRIAGLCC